MKNTDNELTNNAAGRLLFAITSLTENVKGANETVGSIIKRTFGDEKDPFVIFIEIANLTYEAGKEIKRLPVRSQKIHLEPIRTVQSALKRIGISHSWQQFADIVDKSTLVALELTADHLSHLSTEKPIKPEEIEQLQTEVQDLLELVLSTEFDPVIKSFLIENIEKMRAALLYYRINGAKGMKEALEKTIGALSIFGNEELKKTPPNIRERLLIVFSNFAKVASFLNDIKGLADNGTNFPFLPGM